MSSDNDASMVVPLRTEATKQMHTAFFVVFFIWLLVLVVVAGLAYFLEKSPFTVIALVAMAAIVLGMTWYTIALYCLQWVISAELGESCCFRTLFRKRSVSWDEIGRFVLHVDSAPWPGTNSISVMLRDGTTFQMWVEKKLAEEMYQRAQSRLRAPWSGASIGKAAPLVAIGLGITILIMFFSFDYMIFSALGESNVGPPQKGIGRIVKVTVVYVAVHLIGLAGIAYGTYHLIRGPVFYRGGVMKLGSVQAGGLWMQFKTAFFGPK